MKKLIYIGTSHTMLYQLIDSECFELVSVVCEKKRLTQKYIDIIRKNKIVLESFNIIKEFETIILKFPPEEIVYLIYQFDYIVSKKITSKYKMFNLHAGSIRTNRGAHPLIWSVLNGDFNTELTLHLINEKIDQGTLVKTYPVEIDVDDFPSIIKLKMEKSFPLVLNHINLFLDGKLQGKDILGGVYRKPIQEKDFTIDISSDSEEVVKNKIRSQKEYNGAILIINETKYSVKGIRKWDRIKNNSFSINVQEDCIQIRRLDATINLELNCT